MPWKKTGRRSWQRKRYACSQVPKYHSKTREKADFRNELKRKDLAMSQLSLDSDQKVSLLFLKSQWLIMSRNLWRPLDPRLVPLLDFNLCFRELNSYMMTLLSNFKSRTCWMWTNFLNLKWTLTITKDLEFTDSPRHLGKVKPVTKPAPPQRKPFVPVVKVNNAVSCHFKWSINLIMYRILLNASHPGTVPRGLRQRQPRWTRYDCDIFCRALSLIHFI